MLMIAPTGPGKSPTFHIAPEFLSMWTTCCPTSLPRNVPFGIANERSRLKSSQEAVDEAVVLGPKSSETDKERKKALEENTILCLPV